MNKPQEDDRRSTGNTPEKEDENVGAVFNTYSNKDSPPSKPNNSLGVPLPFLTQTRHLISPYLPPPMLTFMRSIDTHPKVLSMTRTDESSTFLLIVILIAHIVRIFLSKLGSTGSGSKRDETRGKGGGLTSFLLLFGGNLLSFGDRRAIVEEEDDEDDDYGMMMGLSNRDGKEGVENGGLNGSCGYTQDGKMDRVVLFGACGGGKTTLFHTLRLLGKQKLKKEEEQEDAKMEDANVNEIVIPHTITSLRADSTVLTSNQGSTSRSSSATTTNTSTDNATAFPTCVHLVDYPGHPTLAGRLTSHLLPPPPPSSSFHSTTTRGILVIDSTRSVADAAEILHLHVLSNTALLDAWRKRQNQQQTQQHNNDKLHILVACNKSNEKKAKNFKRIKIQLRQELEKVRIIHSSTGTGATNTTASSSSSSTTYRLSMDDLGSDIPVQLHFTSLSSPSPCNTANMVNRNNVQSSMNVIWDYVINAKIPPSAYS